MEDTLSLLNRARAGERDALEVLFARYLPRLRRWAQGRLPTWARDLTDTQDIVQDTLLATFKRIDTFEYRGEGALQGYLQRGVINRVREQIRRRSRRPEEGLTDVDHVDLSPSPLQRTIGKQAFDRYDRALATLRPEDREGIIARVEMGMTYDEIAVLQEKPSSDAARKSVRRALAKLIEVMSVR
jgi:RNA polymerase sigma-70 factor, ECF subfamily